MLSKVPQWINAAANSAPSKHYCSPLRPGSCSLRGRMSCSTRKHRGGMEGGSPVCKPFMQVLSPQCLTVNAKFPAVNEAYVVVISGRLAQKTLSVINCSPHYTLCSMSFPFLFFFTSSPHLGVLGELLLKEKGTHPFSCPGPQLKSPIWPNSYSLNPKRQRSIILFLTSNNCTS